MNLYLGLLASLLLPFAAQASDCGANTITQGRLEDRPATTPVAAIDTTVYVVKDTDRKTLSLWASNNGTEQADGAQPGLHVSLSSAASLNRLLHSLHQPVVWTHTTLQTPTGSPAPTRVTKSSGPYTAQVSLDGNGRQVAKETRMLETGLSMLFVVAPGTAGSRILELRLAESYVDDVAHLGHQGVQLDLPNLVQRCLAQRSLLKPGQLITIRAPAWQGDKAADALIVVDATLAPSEAAPDPAVKN